MKSIVETHTNTTVSVQHMLPMLLAVNTFALLAIDQLGGIPDWIKSAVALLLGF